MLKDDLNSLLLHCTLDFDMVIPSSKRMMKINIKLESVPKEYQGLWLDFITLLQVMGKSIKRGFLQK